MSTTRKLAKMNERRRRTSDWALVVLYIVVLMIAWEVFDLPGDVDHGDHETMGENVDSIVVYLEEHQQLIITLLAFSGLGVRKAMTRRNGE